MIINDRFEKASEELLQIIAQERPINSKNTEEVEQFLAQLLSY